MTDSTADELAKLASLHHQGILSEKEFNSRKRALLRSGTGSTAPGARHTAGVLGAVGVALAVVVALVAVFGPRTTGASKGSGVVAFQNASATSPATLAVQWAESMVGSPLGTYGHKYWYGCLAFTFQAYEQAQYPIRSQVNVSINGNTYPYDIWGHLVGGDLGSSNDMAPPAGALVFWFSRGGVGDSHVAISVGNGNLVSTNVDQNPPVPHESGIHYETMAQFQSNSWNIYKGWWLPTGTPSSAQIAPNPGPSSSQGSGSPSTSGYTETAGGVTHTWSDYQEANGTEGPSIAANESVQVACKVNGFRVSDGNTWWYRVGSSPWSNAYYASADAFYNNGRTSGSLSNTPFVDNSVPDCSAPAPGGQLNSTPSPSGTPGPASAGTAGQPAQGSGPSGSGSTASGSGSSESPSSPPPTSGSPSSPPPTAGSPSSPPPTSGSPSSPGPPPTTYAETVGGVAHTWTDYSNAGGSEGPSIASNQTVQIACKVTGFRVADGNTWWYRIASSPWNNSYFVSADAFYNNGQTSGSLSNTPFVDNNVPNC